MDEQGRLVISSVRREVAAEMLSAWRFEVRGTDDDGHRIGGDVLMDWAPAAERFIYDPMHSALTVDDMPATDEQTRDIINRLRHSDSEKDAYTAILDLAKAKGLPLDERLQGMAEQAREQQ